MTDQRPAVADAAPDFTPGYPSGYARLGPGWQAVWDALPDDWTTRAEVVQLGAERSGLAAATVGNLLQQAAARRLIRRRYRHIDGRRHVQYRRKTTSS
jgi:hypothetical protein